MINSNADNKEIFAKYHKDETIRKIYYHPALHENLEIRLKETSENSN